MKIKAAYIKLNFLEDGDSLVVRMNMYVSGKSLHWHQVVVNAHYDVIEKAIRDLKKGKYLGKQL